METVAGQIEEELREIESMDEDANITKIEALKNQGISLRGPVSSIVCC